MSYGTPEYWQRQAESLGRENANLRRQVDCYGENWNTAIRRLTELGETADWSFWARHLMVLDEMHRLEAEQLERFRLAVVDAVLKLEAANATPERTGLVLPDVIRNASARYRGSARAKAEASVDARLAAIRDAINGNQDDLFEGAKA